ncbi:pilus assembly protein TadE [Naumannella halotolerans]|uniref:Putative Flp pilus-assembly TadE/G-like protein n=1 Tax=Naumannella halotolerans TaxID=993414 RepID=A0A4R7JA76_9ACTN|nr:pilus assembly protein TadE [Naumannella halotolerans]TDT34224.1 putative Flp pilus-assembly TadE/G-like protein [Naumannella halotolerans]
MSASVLLASSMTMVVLLLGLVVDGGRQLAAQQRAEAIALQAARAGADAGAAGSLVGAFDAARAGHAARQALGDAGVEGRVSVADARIRVVTEVSSPTVFLAAIGIGSVSAEGRAEAALLPRTP